MKLTEIADPKSENKPTFKYHKHGDGSHTVRVEYPDGRVFVHTNKNINVLNKLIAGRYK